MMPAMSARAALETIVRDLGLATDFPEAVTREVAALEAAPGVDDAHLVDRTAWPFVTVDAATSRDLDQALFLAREGDGYLVAYAIADAAFYVRPGSALFAEALKRAASYYLPGFSVPMLPRALSEGLVSLNPDGPRRALLFLHRLDARGQLLDTRLERARVRSHGKLAFADVQRLVDAPASSPLAGAPYEESLHLLREVGRLRMALAAERGLVRYRREEVQVHLDGEGLSFAVMEAVRDEVELWNEQLSLLCNAEGGRLLREHPSPALQPIYRVQEGPDPARLAQLARLTERVAALHQLPSTPWQWDGAATPLAEYLARLPVPPPGTTEDRVARALARQAVMVNLRSEYSTEPGRHAGVGAEPYARFSAPMREVVGVFLHKEMVELLSGGPGDAAADQALRGQVVEAANRARATQRRVQDLANEVVLDRLFAPEVQRPPAQRTRFAGTVMGLTSAKVHVRLDAPPLDVKLYLYDLARAFDGAWLEVAEEGAVLRKKGGAPVLLLGQAVTLVVDRRDPKTKRWVLLPT